MIYRVNYDNKLMKYPGCSDYSKLYDFEKYNAPMTIETKQHMKNFYHVTPSNVINIYADPKFFNENEMKYGPLIAQKSDHIINRGKNILARRDKIELLVSIENCQKQRIKFVDEIDDEYQEILAKRNNIKQGKKFINT